MSERKSKSIFLIGYVSLMIILVMMSSCGVSQLTQEQVKLNYELDKLWVEYRRLLKPRGTVVLTADQPFTSQLIMSNIGWFKYEWIWKKIN